MHSFLFRVLLGIATTLAITLRWSTVGAQPTPSTSAPVPESKVAAAKKLTDEALAAAREGNYAMAIVLYTEAYQLEPHPTLQFNIGWAYMLDGDFAQAEKFFRGYLALAPDGPWAPKARELLASLPVASPPQAASTPQNVISTSSKAPDTVSADAAHAPERALPDVSGARIAADASERRTERLNPRPTDSALHETKAQQAPDEDKPWGSSDAHERGTKMKSNGQLLIGTGVVLGASAIGFFAQGHKQFGLGASIVGFGLIIGGVMTYSHGKQQLRAAKSVAWSPVIGSGFAGITLAGSLP